jgi:hypothetical protein
MAVAVAVSLLFGSFLHKAIGARLQIDPSRCLVYGAGLNARISTPARYFFVQAVDAEGRNITKSLGPV